MQWKPSVVAADFETNGLEYWREDFRVLSSAFSWFAEDGTIKNRFLKGEYETGRQLKIIEEQGIPLAAHNIQFEIGVSKTRFPKVSTSIWQIDTMRMVQNYDNGGKDVKLNPSEMSIEDELDFLEGKKKHSTGLGLQAAISRILPKEWHNHKEIYYKWLRDNRGVRKGQEGANLSQLTDELMEAYNTADTDTTLMLHDTLLKHFAEIGFDWTFDHRLHINECLRFTDAKIRGVKVDREELAVDLGIVESEVNNIVSAFRRHHLADIEQIERDRAEAWVNGVTTDHGKANRRKAAEEKSQAFVKAVSFNSGSTKQLAELYVNRLGIKPTFWTKESKQSSRDRQKNPDKKPFKPNPSFRSVHLPSYGEGGEILQKRQKRQLIVTQQTNLLKLAETDGRWHLDLRACGTKTGRYAGGGGGDVRLNVQGLGRREPLLMSHLVADSGNAFVSVDLASGEPTVVAHYSQDPNYRNACFDMVGKKPYWDTASILQIDDMYLQGASVSPVGVAAMKEAWNTTWSGRGFVEQWLLDSDVIKKDLGRDRAFHKIIILGLMYGLMPRGMVVHAYDNGFDLSLKDAKVFHHAFWNRLYPKVKELGTKLQTVLKRQGALVNQFGYRMTPEQDRLALNYTIQSSVSGIMKILQEKFYHIADYALPVTIIHDELIIQVPTNRIEDCRRDMQLATDSLNADLKWSVNIRTGFVTGNTLYEAK
jgi:hypothetical protein